MRNGTSAARLAVLGALLAASCFVSVRVAEAGSLAESSALHPPMVLAQATNQRPDAAGIGQAIEGWTNRAGAIARSKAQQDDPLNRLRQRMTSCWSVPSDKGFVRLKVAIRFGLDGAGRFSKAPTIARSSGNPRFDQSALRAVRRCGESSEPLPKEADWSDVVVTFDAADFL